MVVVLLIVAIGTGVVVGSVFMGLSLALTSFFVKKGLHGMQSLVVTGICVLNTGFFINFQCLLKIRLILWMLSVYCVTNISLSVC